MKPKQKLAPAAPQPPAKTLYSVAEACHITGKSRTSLYEALADGRLKALKDGDRTRLTSEAISDFVASLAPWKPARLP